MPNARQHLSNHDLTRTTLRLATAIDRVRQLETLVRDLQAYADTAVAQNEELMSMQRLLEDSRDRYVDLFDYLPIAYVTLNARGVIEEVNTEASRLLGVNST